MAASATRHFDPPKSHELYILEILDRRPGDPVVIRASPRQGVEPVAEDSEDYEFNLSDHIGYDSRKNTLEWGLSGFESVAKSIIIRKYAGPQRYLSVELDDTEETLAVNLDEYLALVEYYDEQTGEIKTKLDRKPEGSKRSIILCFDGTSNQFSNQNTNVVKLVELLKKDDPSQQMVYYQAGVGTYSAPGFLTGVGENLAATADKAVAWYLYQHVIDGYKYLMATYRAGDQISIFGFSRGAYTARALAGMLHAVGLLPRHNLEQVPFAYQIYEQSKETHRTTGEKNSAPVNSPDLVIQTVDQTQDFTADPKKINPDAFKRAFSIHVTITFLGVWDTVGSIGTLKRKTLPYVESNPSVKYFRQALALDENRGNFIPSLWDHSGTILGQSVLEVWFKGGHADVGGGSDPPEDYVGYDAPEGTAVPRLSNIALRWMIRQCHTPGVRILFDPKTMRHYRKHKILAQRRSGDDDEAFQRAISALDERDVVVEPYLVQEKWTKAGWAWWILDKLPVPKTAQTPTEGSHPPTAWMPNNGAARVINQFGKTGPIRLHASVYMHLQKYASQGGSKGKGYLPAAGWKGWEKNQWPTIEGGSMPSVMKINDAMSAPVRDALIMSWQPKPEAGYVEKIKNGAVNTVVATKDALVSIGSKITGFFSWKSKAAKK